MMFQAPKQTIGELNLTSIVQQANEERQACYDRLAARLERKLESRIAAFLKQHKIDNHIRRAANHGLNEVRIPILPKYNGARDLTEPIEELYDPHYDVRVMYNHNAFFNGLEAHVFKEDNIEGRVVFSEDREHDGGKAVELFISWASLLPSPLTLDLLWDANYTVSQFVENETVGELIDRLHLRPRDGTPLQVRNGRRRVGPNSLVSAYHGKTLIVRPEGIENALEGVDL